MPSSTTLLETEESELPPLVVHGFTGIGLDDPGTHSHTEQTDTLSHQRSVSHFSLLGTVLDLQPIPRHQTAPTGEEDEERTDEGVLEENGTNTLLAQAQVSGLGSVMTAGMETPETVLLYNDELSDDSLQPATGMMILKTVYGEPGYEVDPPLLIRRKSVNTTECVGVPSSEHVAEIVGRQGCKIKALRAKTNTYIKTPVRGEQPVFVVTGRKEDVAMAKREILSAAEHFSLIRASRNKAGPLTTAGPGVPGVPSLPGQTTIQVRVPYRVVGLVVGPKGATIKRIQQQTHTYIVTPSRDKEPVFEVSGMPENVDRAREEIEAHIALRTGNSVEVPGADDNDFHYNGTDVSFEAAVAGGCGGAWLQANAAAQRASAGGGGVRMSATYRNDSSSSLGSGSTDSFYGGGGANRMADFSPTSPFNSNSNNNNNSSSGGGASFWFGETLLPLGPADDMAALGAAGFDSLNAPAPQAQVVWSPFEQAPSPFEGRKPLAPPLPQASAPLRGDSHPGTPRLSPTFPDALEHPLAQRVQSAAPRAAPSAPPPPSMSDLHNFPSYGPAFSSSSDSGASSSPPDSSSSSSSSTHRGRQECLRCLESELIAALVPCGHNLFCIECATRICQSPDALCPICQAHVTQAIRLRSL
ncbi:LOW QUALITY PROTEIN: RNA-binding protein MEX3B [Osmerus mordax]|uniref:LOW QUALITY PROTEIN: RNA-binding protein MEX3B n=1 Tax=Osmerus mordax TaxID=8014 RepID=UPI003510C590